MHVPLAPFFGPRGVAVIGAAREPGKVGHVLLRNVLAGGFEGPIFPVNPNASEVLGVRSYASVSEVPGPVDLAVVTIPAHGVPGVIDECARAGIRAAIVCSAGFSESGREGAALQDDLIQRARAGGVRVLGPNCLGLIAAEGSLNASFAGPMPPAGWISFMSQSGALGTAILDRAHEDGVGIAHFVSLGNRADIAEPDLFTAWGLDTRTRVIVAYLESVADGTAFLEAARQAVTRKPVVVLKSGTSDTGARAVSSHTGSLAGSDVAYEAAFRHVGIIRARTVEQLFDYAAGFALQAVPSGQGLAIVTNAGGPAVMATDLAEHAGVALASFEQSTVERLRRALPPAAALYNPVDVLGDAGPERYREALDAVYADPGVRAVAVLLTPQAMTDADEVARAVVDAAARAAGTTTVACFMGGPSVSEARNVLVAGSIPSFPTPERAVETLAAMGRYSEWRSTTPPQRISPARPQKVSESFEETRASGREFVAAQRGIDIARAYGIRVPAGELATDLYAARGIANRIGYPVALKIASPDILHKSDVGGIRIGIESEAELARAYDEVLDRARAYAPDAVIDGVHVQKMTPPGREVIIGVDRDPVFGPLLMFGLGGIYVEVLKDVTFRLCPVGLDDAHRMMTETRSFGLLRGARGQPRADLDAVADAISRVSELALDYPEVLELDINPLIVGAAGEGVWAVDVRIGIGGR